MTPDPKPVPLDYQINPGQREKTKKFYLRANILFTFESIKNIKAMNYWIYTYSIDLFFCREDEPDPESNIVQLT